MFFYAPMRNPSTMHPIFQAARTTLSLVVCACLLTLSTPDAWAAEINSQWTGGTGNWNSAGNWNPAVVPHNSTDTYNVLIDDGDTGTNSVVTLDTNRTVDSVTIDASDELGMDPFRQLTIVRDGGRSASGVLDNAGVVSTNSSSYFRFDGDLTLTGGGELQFANNNSNGIYAVNSGDRLTNVDNTIRGAGHIGFNQSAITNQGIFQADETTALAVRPIVGSSNFNSGTMRATGGGTLSIDGTWNNTGGTIEVQDNSTAELSGVFTGGNFTVADGGDANMNAGMEIIGGTLSTTGTGKFSPESTGASTPPLLNGVTSSGLIEVGDSRSMSLQTSLNNSGTLSLNANVSFSILRILSDLTLNGGGQIVLSNDNSNTFSADTSGFVLTNVDNTIRGAGNLGGSNMGIINQGIIQADQSVTLAVNPVGTSNVNSNIMRATSGGTLSVSGTWDNSSGTIEVQDNSTGTLSGVFTGGNFSVANGGDMNMNGSMEIIGGTLSTTGTGKFSPESTGASTPPLLNGVTSSGLIEVGDSRSMSLQNSLNNSGTLSLNANVSFSILRIQSDLTLNGGGEIVMSNDNSNTFSAGTSGFVLTNVDNTIRGSGNLGGSNMSFINQGIIQADQTVTLGLNPVGTANTNSGTIRATSGGTLTYNGTWDNTGGSVEAQANSVINLNGDITGGNFSAANTGTFNLNNGSSIIGGTLSTTGSGLFVAQSSSTGALLDSVTNTGAVEIAGFRLLDLQTSLNNSGTITLPATASNANLRILGDVNLTGGGEIILEGSNSHVFRAVTSGDLLTNVGNTIRGRGVVGNNNMAINNQAIIQGDDSGGTLTVNPIGSANLNTGTIQAISGGTLALSGIWNNTGGQIEAQTGSTLNIIGDITGGNFSATGTGEVTLQNGASIIGGVLTTAGSGKIAAQANFTPSLLDGVTSSGIIDIENGRFLNLANTFENSGTVTLNSSGGSTYLRIENDTNLNGGGEIVLTHNSGSRFYSTTSGLTLTNVDNSIRGIGILGNGSMNLINEGTIRADGAGTLTINTPSPGTHDGSFQATGGAALSIFDDFSGSGSWDANGGKIQLNSGVDGTTTGTIQVRNGGELELNNSTISGSDLTADSSATIDIGSTVSLTGNFSFAMTDENDWQWSSSGILEMNGGVGANTVNWNNWVRLEVGGSNLGTDAITHTGDGAGFANSNFYLPRIVIGSDAHVTLIDFLDNGNRNGPFGPDEALYVDTLEFTDSNGVLNLNGLDLYYNTLIGNLGQIINQEASFGFGPVPEPGSFTGLACFLLFALWRKRRQTR